MATESQPIVAAPAPFGRPRQDAISRTILKLAWPVVVERLSISVLSGVDAALVGRYVGADGIAAVGIGSLMFWIVLAGALAIDIGSTAIVARDYGAGDRSRAQAGLHAGIVVAVAWGVLATVVVFAGAPWMMRAMGAKPEVAPLGVEFLRAGSLGFPMILILYAVSGSLRGMGNTWLPMAILIVINIINAAVTFLLISGHVADLGVRASGIGYASASIAGGVLALAATLSGVAPVRLDPSKFASIGREAFARLLRIGVPVGLEETQFMLAFLVYTRIIARLGTDQLAAHSLALRSLEIAILPGFALGTAATALVSRFLGAGDADMAEDIARRVRAYAVGTLVVMAVVQFALAPWIVRLFVDDPEVVRTGTRLLRVFAFALPAVGLHGSMSGVLRGAGDVRFVLGTFTVCAWCIRVPIAFLMVVVLSLGAPFAWLAAVVENWTRALLILRRLRQGKWKHLRV